MKTKITMGTLLALVILSLPLITFAQTPNVWSPLGPTLFPTLETGASDQINGIGRVNQIKFDPIAATRLYAVAAHALFVSNDNATSWTVVSGTDKLPTGTTSSVCIDHLDNQIIYLGTGDGPTSSTGTGVWKSTDGGATFVQSNTGMGNRLVIEILMSKTDNKILVAATNDGMYRTTNAGANWVQIASTDNVAFTDMRKSYDGENTLFAVNREVTGKPAGVLYKSTDFGLTWSTIVVRDFSTLSGRSAARVAVTPANVNVVYVTFVGTNSSASPVGGIVYKSTDAGATFTMMKDDIAPNLNGYTGSSSGQGNYNYDMEVSPTDANTLYIVGHIVWKSTDGGVTWARPYAVGNEDFPWAFEIHTDMHGIRFDPRDFTKIYNVNDGGVWLSTNGGVNWLPKSDGLAGTEFYHFGNTQASQHLYAGGTQDNGEVYYSRAKVATGLWYTNRGGDFTATYKQDFFTDGMVYYSDGQKRNLLTKPSGSGSRINLRIPTKGTSGDIYAFSQQSAGVAMYAHTYNSTDDAAAPNAGGIYRTTTLQNTTPTWTQIYSHNTTLRSFALSPSDANIAFVVHDNKIFKSTDALATTPTFTELVTTGLAGTGAAYLLPISSDILYYSISNKVFRSANGGSAWTDITSGLPGNVFVIEIQKDNTRSDESVYAITPNSVYYRNANMTSWRIVSVNLPTSSRLTDIELFYTGQTPLASVLRVSTYGRGLWEMPLNYDLAPLPLKLLSFSAVQKGVNNLLIWQTTQEINTQKFEVQRTSDLVNFQTIGTVAAAGTSYLKTNYAFPDNGVEKNVNYYYRLKMIDNDATYVYSDTIHLRNNLQTDNVMLQVLPNPIVNDNLHLQITAPLTAKATIEVFDVTGRVLYTKQIQVQQGEQAVDMDVSTLKKGTYIVRVLFDNGVGLTKKFLR